MAQEERPDLIILDIGLPARDGFIVLDRLQQSAQLSSIPVNVLTARDPQYNRERTLKAGACAFLQKPADNNELMDVIRTTLNPVWLQARWRRGIRAPQVLEIKVDAIEVSASTNFMVSREVSLPLNQNRETRRRPPPTATRSSKTAIHQSGKRDVFTKPVRARYPAYAPITPPTPPNIAPITEE